MNNKMKFFKNIDIIKNNPDFELMFTDGSVKKNKKGIKNNIGGIGVYFNDKKIICEKFTGSFVTNQTMELNAVLYGLKQSNDNVIIITDSMYVINIFTSWINEWEKNSWKKKYGQKIKNLDIIKKIYDEIKKKNVYFVHVNSHIEEFVIIQQYGKESLEYKLWKGNYMADYLAKK